MADDRELIIVHRNLTGELNRGAEIFLELQVGCGPTDAFSGLMPRLKRRKIQHRLNFDKVSKLRRLGWATADEFLPRECAALSGQHIVQGFFCQGKRPGQSVGLDLSAEHTL